jgi:serine/threonine-protein phosphatase 2A activator
MAEKKIISRQHLDAFLHSQTHQDVVDFLEALNDQAIGVTLRQDCFESEVCTTCALRSVNQALTAVCR